MWKSCLLILMAYYATSSRANVQDGNLNKIGSREDWINLAKYHIANHKTYNVKKYQPYSPGQSQIPSPIPLPTASTTTVEPGHITNWQTTTVNGNIETTTSWPEETSSKSPEDTTEPLNGREESTTSWTSTTTTETPEETTEHVDGTIETSTSWSEATTTEVPVVITEIIDGIVKTTSWSEATTSEILKETTEDIDKNTETTTSWPNGITTEFPELITELIVGRIETTESLKETTELFDRNTETSTSWPEGTTTESAKETTEEIDRSMETTASRPESATPELPEVTTEQIQTISTIAYDAEETTTSQRLTTFSNLDDWTEGTIPITSTLEHSTTWQSLTIHDAISSETPVETTESSETTTEFAKTTTDSNINGELPITSTLLLDIISTTPGYFRTTTKDNDDLTGIPSTTFESTTEDYNATESIVMDATQMSPTQVEDIIRPKPTKLIYFSDVMPEYEY